MSRELIVLIGPPLVLLVLSGVAIAWVAAGGRRRLARQAAIAAALRPTTHMGPPPDGGRRRSHRRSLPSEPATERSRS
jgi:hypothetical protein